MTSMSHEEAGSSLARYVQDPPTSHARPLPPARALPAATPCSSCITATSTLSELSFRLQRERGLRLHAEQRVLQLERQVTLMKHLTATQESSRPCATARPGAALLTIARSLSEAGVGRVQLKDLSTEQQLVQTSSTYPDYLELEIHDEVEMQEADEDVVGPCTPPRTSRTHVEDCPSPTPVQWLEAGAAAAAVSYALAHGSPASKRSRHVHSAAPASMALTCQHASHVSAATFKAPPPPPPPATTGAAGTAPAVTTDAMPGTLSGSGSGSGSGACAPTGAAAAATAYALSLPDRTRLHIQVLIEQLMPAVNGQVVHMEPIQQGAYGYVARVRVAEQEVAVKAARLRRPVEVDQAAWLELGPISVSWAPLE